MKQDNALQVYYDEKLVGTLAMTADHKAAFQYDDEWLENGFAISPFSLPLKKQVFVPTKDYFGGLFGVFADSLPDNWGNLLLNRLLRKHKQNPDDLTVLDRLAIVGKSGIERLLLSDGEDYKTIHGWDDLDSAEEEDVKLFVDHISVICLLYNMFFKKECFAQEQEYRMVFLCVHRRKQLLSGDSISVEYRIKDEVFIPFIRMKLGDISCLKSVCVGTKNTSDLAVKGLRHYFGSRNLEVRVKKSEIPLRY